MSQDDLAAILAGARRGREQDVASLVERLPNVRVVLPLAQPKSDGQLVVDVHVVPGPLGEKLGPIFTDERILSRVGHRLGWKTADDALQLLETPGRHALEMTLEIARSGAIFGGAINPYDPTALDLRPVEIESILKGDPKPLQRRLRHFPIRTDHGFFTGADKEPSPKDMERAIAQFVEARPELARHVCMTASVNGRDKPVLHVTLWTNGVVDEPATTAALRFALRGNFPSEYGGIMVVYVYPEDR